MSIVICDKEDDLLSVLDTETFELRDGLKNEDIIELVKSGTKVEGITDLYGNLIPDVFLELVGSKNLILQQCTLEVQKVLRRDSVLSLSDFNAIDIPVELGFDTYFHISGYTYRVKAVANSSDIGANTVFSINNMNITKYLQYRNMVLNYFGIKDNVFYINLGGNRISLYRGYAKVGAITKRVGIKEDYSEYESRYLRACEREYKYSNIK